MAGKYGTILDTPEGNHLYRVWCNFRSKQKFSQEFDTFPGFYDWSMANGYKPDYTMVRRDTAEPYSPDNCVWIPAAPVRPLYGQDLDRAFSWNITVNRLRRHFGLEPFPETREAEA